MRDYRGKSFAARAMVLCGCLVLFGMRAPFARAAGDMTGFVNGIVVDMHDVPVQHAQVELDDIASGAMKDITTTDDTGGYVFQGVEPGKYMVTITADRFLPWEIQDVNVSAGRTVTVARVRLRSR